MVKDILEVSQDYRQVKGTWAASEDSDSYYVESLFEQGTYETRIPLANNYGMIRANQYVEFVSSQLFCPDGSWIGFESKENTAAAKRAAAKVVNYLGQKLAETNFYSQITKLIKSGVLYNRGTIDAHFDKGLQFKTFKNDDIAVSEDCDESNKRIYITKYISTADLISSFEGDAVEARATTVSASDLVKQIRLVTAILPVNDIFFDEKYQKTPYKYRKLYFLCNDDSSFQQIQRKDAGMEGYIHFPLMTYVPQTQASLASLAVPTASRLNEYEQLIGENARKANRPALAVADTLTTHDNYSFDEGGLVFLATNDRKPEPIESRQRLAIDARELQRLEIKIDIVFKTHLIERVNVTNVSQFEASRNYLNALKAIQPSAADLVTRVPLTLLSRIHSLLMDNDKEYRRLAKAANGKLTMYGLSAKMRQLKKASNLGYFAQAATPYLEMDPQGIQRVNTDMALKELAASLDVYDVTRTDEEVDEEQQAVAQQMQAQQAQEQQVVDAETAAKQAQAQSALSK